MQDDLLVPVGTPPLSQGARVLDTFIAPSKTFTDILRSAACWLPLVLMFFITIGSVYAVDRKVGFDGVVEQQIAKNPKAEERMQSVPADQRASSMAMQTKITRIISYSSFIFVIVIFLLEALVLWASFNFGLGARTTFPQVFAVITFAALPRFLVSVLNIILLYAGVGTESYDIRNPVGTNIGYYLSDATPWLKTAASFFDILGFWTLALLILGMAIISGKKISQSATVIIGWFVLIMLISVGFTAAFS